MGLVLVALVLVVYNLKPTTYNLPASLILAGGISNLADRLVWGGVRDVFTLGTLYFNVADIYIVGGLAMVGYALLKRKEQSEK